MLEFNAYFKRVQRIQRRLVGALHRRQTRNAFARLYKVTLKLDQLESEARVYGIKVAA